MRNIQTIANLPFKVNEFQDITDTLPSRPNDPNPMRTPEQITHISIHHSAVENGSIQGYANHHVNTNKWFHIGYHLVIKGDQVFQVNDLLTFSYHTASNNAHTIGISVSANLSKRSLSEVERNNLYAVILTVMDLFNIPVSNVLGHNEYPLNKTSCPSIDMDIVRSDLNTIQLNMALKAALPDRATRVKRFIDATNRIVELCNKAKDPNFKYTDTALDKGDLIVAFLEREKLMNP